MAQRPQRVGERRRRGVVTGDEEHREVADHLVVTQRSAGVRIPRRQQQPHQLAVASGVRLAAGDHLLDHCVDVGQRRTEAALGGGGHPPRCADRPEPPTGHVRQHLLDARPKVGRVGVEVHAEHRPTQHAQGEAAQLSIEVDLGPVRPAGGALIGSRCHVTCEGRDVLPGEEWLERPTLRLPRLVRKVEDVFPDEPRLEMHLRQLVHGVVAGAREDVVRASRRGDQDVRRDDVPGTDGDSDDGPGQVADDAGTGVELPEGAYARRQRHRRHRRQPGRG